MAACGERDYRSMQLGNSDLLAVLGIVLLLSACLPRHPHFLDGQPLGAAGSRAQGASVLSQSPRDNLLLAVSKSGELNSQSGL